MNPKTNEIIRLNESGIIPEGFYAVPKRLEKEANELLGDKESVTLPFTTKNKLNKWAERIRLKSKK